MCAFFDDNGSCLELILLPLHLNGDHWALASVQLDSSRCVIRYFDSLGRSPPSKLAGRLTEFLNGEHVAALGAAASSPLLIEDRSSECLAPKQRNTSDCGVITCICAQRIAASLPVICCTSESRTRHLRFSIVASIVASRVVDSPT